VPVARAAVGVDRLTPARSKLAARIRDKRRIGPDSPATTEHRGVLVISGVKRGS
jgi:hypothetical protein